MSAYFGHVIRNEGHPPQRVAAIVITTYPVDDKGDITLDSANASAWRVTWANPGLEATSHSPVHARNHTLNFQTEGEAREAAIRAIERHYTTASATATVELD